MPGHPAFDTLASPPLPVVDVEILDLQQLAGSFGGITPVVLDLYGAFLDAIADLIAELHAALAASALDKARMTAHSAGGAARNAGARRLGDLFSGIEDALVDDDPATAGRLAQTLDRAFAEVRGIIARL